MNCAKSPRRFPAAPFSRGTQRAFTLVEMLVSMTILVVIMVMVAQLITSTSKVWKNTSSKIEAFQGARAGFQLMTDQLRQATLNTYFDYYNTSGQMLTQWYSANPTTAFVPAAYGRQSELHFTSGQYVASPGSATGAISNNPILGTATLPPYGQITHCVFFQSPADYTVNTDSDGSNVQYSSLDNLLNATGFFIEFGSELNSANSPPAFITGLSGYKPSYRFRLMQFIEPTELLSVYNYSTTPGTNPNDWFVQAITGNTKTGISNHAANVRMVANNIIALVIWPKQYDTANDLPNVASPGAPTTPLAPNYTYDSRLAEPSGTPGWIPGPNATPTPQPLQMNQMPPILRVAMVALDEPSAVTLQGASTTPPAVISQALAADNPNAGGAPLFTVATNMDSDLAYLQTELAAIKPHVNFRVFDTTIAVRSAKFSSQ